MMATDDSAAAYIPPEAKRLPRTGGYGGQVRIVLAIVLGAGALYRGLANHFRFEAWSERRAAWHRRCDAPRNQTYATLSAYAASRESCRQELDALTAEARRKGWLPASPTAKSSPASPAR
jgi:hypothetical protein